MFGYICVFSGFVLSTYSLSDGDLRLVRVEEYTNGTVTYPHKTIRYMCRPSLQDVLQTGSRSSCVVYIGRRGNKASFYNNPISLGCNAPFLGLGVDCYEEVLDRRTWADARRYCHLKVADLPKILDQATNDFLKTRSDSRTSFFLGASDQRQEGVWEYGLDEPVTFTNWYTGEPNNYAGRDHCLQLWHFGWSDTRCDVRQPFFCSRVSLRASISCSGTETRLDQCRRGAWTLNTCGASEVAKVSCSYFYEEGGLPAESTYIGMVQMYYQNKWRFICSGDFGPEESAVVCHQLRSIPHISHTLHARTASRSLTQFYNGCMGGPTGTATCSAIGSGRYTCPSPLNTVECQETQTCTPGRYGAHCEYDCGHCARGNCSVTDGVCPGGECLAGYTGSRCDQACSGDRWGSNCANRCGHCVSSTPVVCDPVNGICTSGLCQDGFSGPQCADACPKGTYGGNCSLTCGHCLGRDCDAGGCINDTCNATGGLCPSGRCKDGYIGDRCTEVCPFGTYGANCSMTCGHCRGTNVTCNATDGVCPSGLCKDGYFGERCLHACPFEHWGPNCLQTCGYCKSPACGETCSSCNAVDGVCLSGLCQDGFIGDTCIDECPNGKWGAGCSQICNHCPGGSCDPKNGLCICSDGSKRSSCETGDLGRLQEGNNTVKEDVSLDQSTWVYYLAGGLCFLFLLVGTGVIVQYIKSKNKEQERVSAM